MLQRGSKKRFLVLFGFKRSLTYQPSKVFLEEQMDPALLDDEIPLGWAEYLHVGCSRTHSDLQGLVAGGKRQRRTAVFLATSLTRRFVETTKGALQEWEGKPSMQFLGLIRERRKIKD